MKVNAAIEAAIERMLYNIIKLLLEWGVTEATFSRIARRTFVKVAAQKQHEEIHSNGSEQDEKVTSIFGADRVTATAIQAITGVPRKEIKHLLEERSEDVGDDEWYRNQCTRVLYAWWNTSETTNSKGMPLQLYLFKKDRVRVGRDISFEELVSQSGADVHMKNIVRELVAAECIEIVGSEKPRVKVLKKRYERQGATVESVSEAGDKFFSMGSALTAKLSGSDPAVTEAYVVSMNIDEKNVAKLLNRLRVTAESDVSGYQYQMDREESRDGSAGVRVGAGIYIFRGDEMANSKYFQKIEKEAKESNG